MRRAVEEMPAESVKGPSAIFKVYSHARFYEFMNTVFQEK